MERINIGDIVRTSYNTGPYKIVEITKDCTCPKFLDALSMKNPPDSKPHYHLTCMKLDKGDKSKYYLNGYDNNLNSVWDNDQLINCAEETLFLTMCCGI